MHSAELETPEASISTKLDVSTVLGLLLAHLCVHHDLLDLERNGEVVGYSESCATRDATGRAWAPAAALAAHASGQSRKAMAGERLRRAAGAHVRALAATAARTAAPPALTRSISAQREEPRGVAGHTAAAAAPRLVPSIQYDVASQ